MNDTHPNVIVITTDQQRTDSLSCFGSTFTSTPNFDRLANEGVLCRRAYCTNPVCTPSRVSIFTGQAVSRHGAWNVGMNAHADTRTIGHDFGEAGYQAKYVGKTHFQSYGGEPDASIEARKDWEQRYPAFRGPYYGFDDVELTMGHGDWSLVGHYGHWALSQMTDAEREAAGRVHTHDKPGFGGNAVDWDIPTRLHHSVWAADRTIDFLRQRDPSKPFCMGVGFPDPHHSHAVPTDFDLRVSPNDVPWTSTPTAELADKPAHFMEAHTGTLEQSAMRGEFWVAGQGAGCDYRKVSEDAARRGRAYYYTMVRLIDRELGRILDALDELGLAENTIVVVTSDHGELLGDHGLWMKGPFHYEQLLNVPLIARWPAGLNAGKVCDEPVSLSDLAPTCLAAAGVTTPRAMDGVEQLDAWNQGRSARDHAVVEFVDDPEKLRLKTVVTADRKLTMYHGQTCGELYDLANDPGEKINRWEDPAYAGDRAALMLRLLDFTEATEKGARSQRYCYA